MIQKKKNGTYLIIICTYLNIFDTEISILGTEICIFGTEINIFWYRFKSIFWYANHYFCTQTIIVGTFTNIF